MKSTEFNDNIDILREISTLLVIIYQLKRDIINNCNF